MLNSRWISLKRVLIVSPALILALLELQHPTGDGKTSAFDAILPHVDWWIALHLLQVPLFGLLGLSVILLVNNLRGLAPLLSQIGIGLFWVFYTALDAITGIAGGLLIRGARNLPATAQQFVSKQVNQLFFDPLVGGTTLSLVGVLGAGGWLLGVGAAAFALQRAGVDRLTTALFGLAAILFAMSHTPPTGPLGLFFFFLAAIRIPNSVLSNDSINQL
jgi:hypothetical protein